MPPRRKPEAKPADKSGEEVSARKQYNLGFAKSQAAVIDDVADGLGLDPTNLLRMIVSENLPRYVRRVEQIRRGETPTV